MRVLMKRGRSPAVPEVTKWTQLLRVERDSEQTAVLRSALNKAACVRMSPVAVPFVDNALPRQQEPVPMSWEYRYTLNVAIEDFPSGAL